MTQHCTKWDKKPITTPNSCPNSPHQLYLQSLMEIIPTEWPSSAPAKPTFVCVWIASLTTRLKLFGPSFTWWAEKWAAWVFHLEEENTESYRFVDWEDFHREFKEEFCPAHTNIAAVTHLESTSYFQNKCSINGYLNEFLDLISEASYTNNNTIVVKFHRGLDPCIQDAIATMTSRWPSDKVLFQWYNTAWTLDQNQVTNEAFWPSYHVPTSNPIPTQSHPPIPNVVCSSVNTHFIHLLEIPFPWTLMQLREKPLHS